MWRNSGRPRFIEGKNLESKQKPLSINSTISTSSIGKCSFKYSIRSFSKSIIVYTFRKSFFKLSKKLNMMKRVRN